MGLFGRKKQDTVETGVDSSTGIDFSSYELSALSDDIRSIVNVPGAIAQTMKYAITIPFVVAILSWAVFSSRMTTWVLVPFTFVAFCLTFLGSTVIGGFFVARKRLDTVAEASSRVVTAMGDMHADVVRVKDGHAGTSVQQVAVGLLENAIFPMVFGTITDTAETAMGPLGFLASKATAAPIKLVQNSVISAVHALPDREIGAIVSDAGAGLPALSDSVNKLGSEYDSIRNNLENIVAKVSRTALGSVLGLAIVGLVPLAIWLGLGFVLS